MIMLILLAVAVVWLGHRAHVLFSVSTDKAIQILNIHIPKVPQISVDNVTKNSIAIHWDAPFAEDKTPELEGPPMVNGSNSINHYVLSLNGIQVAVIDGNQKACQLTCLAPNTNYQIDLVAFNNSNYRSRSYPIYVKTREESNAVPLAKEECNSETDMEFNLKDDPEDLLNHLAHAKEAEKEKVKMHNTFRKESPPGRRSRSNTIEKPAEQLPNPEKITDIEELRFLLESGQEDLRSILQQQIQCQIEFRDEESLLNSNRADLRQRKKIEDSNRASVKSEIKYLEDSKRNIEDKIAKNRMKLEGKLKTIEEKEKDMLEWNELLEAKKTSNKELSFSADETEAKITAEIEVLNKSIFALQNEIHDLEDDIKDLSCKRKKLENDKVVAAPLFELLASATDQRTGAVSAEGTRALEKIGEINPAYRKEIETEINEDSRRDAQWRALQLKEAQRLQNIYSMRDQEKQQQQQQHAPGAVPAVPMAISTATPQRANPMSAEPSTSPMNPVWSPTNNYFSPASQSRLMINAQPNLANDEEEELPSPSVNMLLPQSLIDSEDLSRFFKITDEDMKASESQGSGVFKPEQTTVPGFDFLNSLGGIDQQQSHTRIASMHSNNNITSSPQGTLNIPDQRLFSSTSNSVRDQSIFEFMASPTVSNHAPVQQMDDVPQPNTMSAFSPKRLTNVFNFGRKSIPDVLATESPPHPTISHESSGNANTSSRFFNILRKQPHHHETFGKLDPFGTNSPQQDLTRNRSESFGSSIWNNTHVNESVEPWGGAVGANSFGFSPTASLSPTMDKTKLTEEIPPPSSQPSIVIESEDDVPKSYTGYDQSKHSGSLNSIVPEDDDAPSSPSFFKKKIFPFGVSPTKVPTRGSDRSSVALTDEGGTDQIPEIPTTTGSPVHSKSSRFFSKISRRNSQLTVASQLSTSSPSSGVSNKEAASASLSSGKEPTTSNSFARRLSFLSKKEKEADKHGETPIIRENEELS